MPPSMSLWGGRPLPGTILTMQGFPLASPGSVQRAAGCLIRAPFHISSGSSSLCGSDATGQSSPWCQHDHGCWASDSADGLGGSSQLPWGTWSLWGSQSGLRRGCLSGVLVCKKVS